LTDAVSPAWLRYLRDEVRARIRAQHSTQASLAASLGVTPKHLSQVLTGTIAGSPWFLDRMAAAVGLRITVVPAADREPVLLGRDQRGLKSGRKRAGEGAGPRADR
jgi:transcriptional regulator with XRE-family HTH domain